MLGCIKIVVATHPHEAGWASPDSMLLRMRRLLNAHPDKITQH